ncbi:molybdopterin molybdotransferase MoeA [Gramella sp. AN32]|uniref:Molybdopterin molybdenumtransferase n=1 Tax=Christiangramia antarctica TaxID=2058158 RepID=A0ABW5X6H0_9FLAO|nr:molybdopterin molybdotransferase MoeA [Gramella sp. AN32]MCM4156207.1 molybdopterin molybdenumtransferase MoeA [Gramella sp. AN32]
MISYQEAYKIVIATKTNFGIEEVELLESTGRVLAEDIKADRDFPPFNRSTKDGIAVNSEEIRLHKPIKIEGVCAAGSTQKTLENAENCMEIMTGAVLPQNTDAVIMYEEIDITGDFVTITKPFKKDQNIHKKGSDQKKGEIILRSNTFISAGEIGILATVGKSIVKVQKLPKIAIISTGNELVDINETPLPHQIRMSNSLTLKALLDQRKIESEILHLPDEKDVLEVKIREALNKFDVLLLSGGVSKGKYDFLPEVFEKLKVEKLLHRVAQQPGKPFWFGESKETGTHVFSFPGNPVSTFVNFHLYFRDWLLAGSGIHPQDQKVVLKSAIENLSNLTKFLLVKVENSAGILTAELINGNGSGDLISLSKSSGVIKVNPNSKHSDNKEFTYIHFD